MDRVTLPLIAPGVTATLFLANADIEEAFDADDAERYHPALIGSPRCPAAAGGSSAEPG
jgi:hypothetical protein